MRVILDPVEIPTGQDFDTIALIHAVSREIIAKQ